MGSPRTPDVSSDIAIDTAVLVEKDGDFYCEAVVVDATPREEPVCEKDDTPRSDSPPLSKDGLSSIVGGAVHIQEVDMQDGCCTVVHAHNLSELREHLKVFGNILQGCDRVCVSRCDSGSRGQGWCNSSACPHGSCSNSCVVELKDFN